MQNLSIGFFCPGWPLEAFSNGIVTYVSTVAPALRSLGHGVSILAAEVAPGMHDPAVFNVDEAARSRSWPRRISDGLWYRVAPRTAIRSLAWRVVGNAARRIVRERLVQVFEVEESFGLGLAIQRATRVPVCVRLHGPYFLTGPAGGAPQDDDLRQRVRAEGAAIAAAAALSAPASDVLQKVRAHYGMELPDAEAIPNPVAYVPREQRWRLGDCERKRVLFVGRFDRLKGGDSIVEAFVRVLREFPDARLTLVGPDGECMADDGRRWGLEEFVRSRLPGALESGRIEWLGRQPAAALPAIRRRALVSVVCSRYENFPYTVTEAMALGCPLVAARVAGIPEAVRDGVNGLLHGPGDAADLAARILALLRLPERAAALGDRAGADAERRLHPDVVAKRLLSLYQRALERWSA